MPSLLGAVVSPALLHREQLGISLATAHLRKRRAGRRAPLWGNGSVLVNLLLQSCLQLRYLSEEASRTSPGGTPPPGTSEAVPTPCGNPNQVPPTPHPSQVALPEHSVLGISPETPVPEPRGRMPYLVPGDCTSLCCSHCPACRARCPAAVGRKQAATSGSHLSASHPVVSTPLSLLPQQVALSSGCSQTLVHTLLPNQGCPD